MDEDGVLLNSYNSGNILLLLIGIIIVRSFVEKVNSYNNYYQLCSGLTLSSYLTFKYQTEVIK